MIKTEYKINFAINDENFNIIVKEPSLKEKKELELALKPSRELLENSQKNEIKRANLNRAIKENEEMILINKELSNQSGFGDKFSLLMENKTLLKKNKELNLELEKIELVNFNEIEAEFERVLGLKNEMLISGDDKEKLLNTLKEKGIKNSYFWEILSSLIIKEQEKK